MDDRRIAEWLSVDAPYGESASDSTEMDAPAPGEQPPADVREAPGARRATMQQRRRRALVASGAESGLEEQQARVLELVAAVARRIRRRPLAALAIGAGLGFVIGGALSFRAGRLLLAAGARQVARELLKQLI
jgi:ElaB/YqjD/DUF883 family membrane-anchored ribosome-binding protein